MKTLLLVLTMLPMMAMASEDFDLPGTPVSDEQMSDVVGSLGYKCARFSDMWCFGKQAGSLCVSDPSSGRSGFCNQRDMPNERGEVSCSCF